MNVQSSTWTLIRQPGKVVRRGHDTLIAIEIYSTRESPPSIKCENPCILPQQYLCLHIPFIPGMQQHVIVVVDTPKHARVIYTISTTATSKEYWSDSCFKIENRENGSYLYLHIEAGAGSWS